MPRTRDGYLLEEETGEGCTETDPSKPKSTIANPAGSVSSNENSLRREVLAKRF
jgi:hypothetical protein